MKTALVTLFLYIVPFFHFHPLHVTVMNIEHDRHDRMLNVTVKIFANDLEDIIHMRYGIALKLGSHDENKDWAGYIEKYFGEQIKISVNNNQISVMKNISRIAEDDALWISFQVPVPEQLQKIVVTNLLLTDLYYDQVNLLMLTCNGRDYSKKLDIHDAVLTVYLH